MYRSVSDIRLTDDFLPYQLPCLAVLQRPRYAEATFSGSKTLGHLLSVRKVGGADTNGLKGQASLKTRKGR